MKSGHISWQVRELLKQDADFAVLSMQTSSLSGLEMHKGFLISVLGHTAPANILLRQLSYASIIAVFLDL